jgi:superoxide dismutase
MVMWIMSDRNEFLATWWNLVNWKEVNRRFEGASK